jgi:uncharacterized protein (TIRG00374 family)
MKKKTVIRSGIIILLTLVFVYLFAKSVRWPELLANITQVNPWFFALLIILAPLHLFTRSWRWRYLIKPEKKNPRFYNLFASNAIGFTVTLLLPGRLGEIVKPLFLAKKENIRKGFALGTVVVERIFDMLTVCFLLGVFLIIRPLSQSMKVGEATLKTLRTWGIIGVGVALFLLAIVLSLHFFRDRTIKVINFFLKPFPAKFRAWVDELMEEFIQGLKFFHSFGNLAIFLGLSLVVWLLMVFYYWIFLLAYKVIPPFFLVFPYIFLTMVGASIPTPGMVGGFDYFSKLAITSLYGISATKAAGMTMVVHAIQVIMTCLCGYAILLKERVSLFQLRKLGENNRK